MPIQQEITDYVRGLAAMSDHQINVAQAALEIARYQYPSLDTSSSMSRLVEMSDRLNSRIRGLTEPIAIVREMNRMLFEEEAFKINDEYYYDPRNCLLNQVLERKLGIPVTLSIVYIETGRRCGLSLYGVGLPGHFITGLLTDTGRILIDPSNRGEILSEDACRHIALLHAEKPESFSQRFLDPVWPRRILVRLLRNLKANYWRRGAELRALQVIQWITMLDPTSPAEYKESGYLYQGLGDFQRAADDYERYLQLAPEAEDREMIEKSIAELRAKKSTVH